MAATRSLYRSVAKDFANMLDAADRLGLDRDTLATAARNVAQSFKIDRSEFRYDKFFEACGLDGFGYVKGTQHV